ncbi:MAG: DUF4266 domain-containing protein [Gammaproteobacteria bacterium]|nr:DUF4266 domain-containing protein [Gammaproteobacteria bacterium]
MNKGIALGSLLSCTLLLPCLPGCAYEPVKAYQRGKLANPVMVRDANPAHSAFEQHVYSSKESTAGGYSTGAGGCGCN